MNNNSEVNDLNDLNDLKNYLKNKYNINLSIRLPTEKKTNVTIQDIYLKLFIQIIILILCIYIYLKNKKYKIYNIILFFIILYILYNIFCYFYKIYLYNHIYNNNNYINYINYNDINFSTGDIIQEKLPWYNNFGIFINILNNSSKYLHGGMVIRFENKNYLLHLAGYKCYYSKPILYFNNNNNIEICPLDNYIKDNYYCNSNYRLFKINPNKKIDNDKLFNVLKEFDIKKIIFKIYIHFAKNNNYNDNFDINYNCLNFIFKILYKLNIIPLFNFQNILNDDFLFLPNLSNNIYNKEIIIQAK
jgi:hypothetical protein